MVYQEPMASLNPSITIGRQLMEVPLYHGHASKAEARERAIDMLANVHLPHPSRIFESYPHQLAGGQQQRVVLAMALLANPSLLLLDEPTTALDVTVAAGIVELIREIGERFGTAMIHISHNLGLILETCHRITIMYAGEAIEEGLVGRVFFDMRHPYTHGLLNSIPMPGIDKTVRPLRPIPGQLPLPHRRPKGCFFGPRCDHFREGTCDRRQVMEPISADSRHMVRCARHREIDWSEQRLAEQTDPPVAPGPVVLQVRDLKKHYELRDRSPSAIIRGRAVHWIKANEKLDFDAREAETVAIVGESGCGKSTFAKVLMGLEQATSGAIVFDNREISRVPVERRDSQLVRQLQMVFQNPFETLNPSHTVGTQIGRVIRRFGVARNRCEVQERAMQLLDLVKLPRAFYWRRPHQLSGGQKQRVGIARAFAGNPRVVVADEPVSALDVSVQAAITQLLMDIQRRNRTTLLFISHDLSLVRYLADRVVVMYLGHVVEQGTTDQVFSPPYHPYTEALLSAVPLADPRVKKKRIVLEGEIASAVSPPPGCPFQSRCPRKLGRICETEMPPAREFAGGHRILCHIEPEDLRQIAPVVSVTWPRTAT